MFCTIYKNTMKEILRFRATIISLIIFLIFNFLFQARNYAGTFQIVRYSDTINTIVYDMGMAILIFTAIFVSFLIVYDIKNFFYDIERATLIKQKTYYIAKFFAFFTFTVITNVLLILDQIAGSFFYTNAYTLFSKPFFTFETLLRFFIAFIWITIPASLTAVILPMSVTAISKNRMFGVISGALYFIFCAASSSLTSSDLFDLCDPSIFQYFLTPSYITYNFLLAKQNAGMFNAIIQPDIDAIMNVVLVLLADLVLLIFSYLVYSRREYKC